MNVCSLLSSADSCRIGKGFLAAFVVAILVINSLPPSNTFGSEPAVADAVDKLQHFETHIRPALINHCIECHSTETEANGGLALDSPEGWKSGGDLGPVIVPGDASASLFMRVIEYEDTELQMPPDGKLNAATILAFRKWIDQGAMDPREEKYNGIKGSSALSVADATSHWAYRPVADVILPPVEMHETSSPIDAFISQRLADQGLNAAGVANKRELIRRLTFDLTGLPPTLSEIDEFEQDSSPLAYDRLVDRLLASVPYAEHFARHWMDVARYAESITLRGFVLPEAWRYRDYLVESYAADRPFHEMIREQIAGDLLARENLHERQLSSVATAFLAMGNSNLEQQDKLALEFDYLDEQLETIGRAFLGQTVGCARCHDHKFDPIPTRDYYALAAIMRSTVALEHANLSKWLEQPLPVDEQTEANFESLSLKLKEIDRELADLNARESQAGGKAVNVALSQVPGIVLDDTQASYVGTWETSASVRGFVSGGYRHDLNTGQGSKTATFDFRAHEKSRAAIQPGVYEVRMAYTPGPNRATNVQVQVFSENEATIVTVNQRLPPNLDGIWVSLGRYPFEADGQAFVMISNEGANGNVIVDAIQLLPSQPRNDASTSVVVDTEDDRANMKAERSRLTSFRKQTEGLLAERPKYLTIVEGEVQKELEIRIRGNVHSLGEKVPRGFLTAIGRAEDWASQIDSASSGRVELANWIADDANPLTARVYANRVWCWLMGEGIVATEDVFGTMGDKPSHPELLDWLANELQQNEWSTKHLVRTIVSSDTYKRQIITPDSLAISVDPDNRLYWTSNVRRLSVEAVRDAMLCVSGELDRRVGGPELRPKTSSDYNYRHDTLRRSLYAPVLRNSLPPLFQAFDFADPSVSVGQRSRSTIPTQSLALLNHPWVVERAWHAATKDDGEAWTEQPEARLDRLFLECFGRLPSPQERDSCLEFLRKSEPSQVALADVIQSLFASIDFRFLD